MSNTIRVGDGLTLPGDAVTQTFAFLARRGAGKSYGAMKLAEGMLDASAQIVALDPVGVWFSLRIAADGKGKGFPILVFGGLHGDLPLEPGAGAFIADLIVDRGISAVLDVSHFRKNDRKRFATDFAEQLFHRKKQRRTPVHLFVEEAQVFIPQRVMGDEARMLGAFEDIIKLGRNFGVGATLISQRPQAVNKDALNQTEALFVLQTNGAQERKALENWIVEQGVESKGIIDQLPSLPIGTAYLWSPSWLRKLEKVKIGKRKTYDASATPVAGVEHVEPKPLSKDELAKVEADMAATIERAKADDPKALRARIAELEKRLAARVTDDPELVVALKRRVAELEAREPERVEVRAIWPADIADLRDHIAEMRGITASLEAALDRAAKPPVPARPVPVARPQRQTPTLVPLAQKPAQRAGNASAGDGPPVKAGARRMLEQLARTGGSLSKRQLGTLAGVKHTSGTFSDYLSLLRTNGYIESDVSTVTITAAGAAAIGAEVRHDPLPTEDVVAMYLPKLKGGAKRMLEILVDHRGAPIAKVDLAEKAGISAASGTFSDYMSSLRSNGLLADVDSRTVRAGDVLFPAGPLR